MTSFHCVLIYTEPSGAQPNPKLQVRRTLRSPMTNKRSVSRYGFPNNVPKTISRCAEHSAFNYSALTLEIRRNSRNLANALMYIRRDITNRLQPETRPVNNSFLVAWKVFPVLLHSQMTATSLTARVTCIFIRRGERRAH